MAIDPISMPDSASIDYGEGDVRHFSEGDAMDVAGLSRPTRHLARRDTLLAEKLNEVVEVVNNKEQFVPLPVLRTVLPPNSEEVIQNFRIPPGFECRVLNAVVTSIPASSSAELDIYYSATYGNSTGTQIVSTSTEYTGGTTYFSSGEFVITLKNRGGSTLEMIASVLVTMRPVGSTAGFLLSSAIPVTPGPPGPPGRPGSSTGSGNPGPPGSPGLVWQSTWSNVVTYDDKAAVFFAGSSFKSKHATNLNNTPVGGISDTHWEFVAHEGDPGFNWLGPWVGTTTYVLNDGVQYLGSSYVCVAASSLNHNPVSYPAEWNLVAQAGTNGFRYRGNWSYPPLDLSGAPYVLNDVVTYALGGSAQTSGAVTATIASGAVTVSATGFLTGTGADVGRVIRLNTSGNFFTITAFSTTTACTVTPATSAGPDTFVISTGASTETYIAVVAIPTATLAPPNAEWNKMFSSSANVFTFNSVPGTLYVEADYQALNTAGPYLGQSLAYPGTVSQLFTEIKITDPATGHGFCALKYARYARWLGSVTLKLPKIADGASLDWQMTDVALSVANSGTTTTFGTVATAAVTAGFAFSGTAANTRLNPVVDRVTLTNPTPDGCNVYLSMIGLQVF